MSDRIIIGGKPFLCKGCQNITFIFIPLTKTFNCSRCGKLVTSEEIRVLTEEADKKPKEIPVSLAMVIGLAMKELGGDRVKRGGEMRKILLDAIETLSDEDLERIEFDE